MIIISSCFGEILVVIFFGHEIHIFILKYIWGGGRGANGLGNIPKKQYFIASQTHDPFSNINISFSIFDFHFLVL